MIISAYDDDDNGNENRICFWLRLDNWHLCEAALAFIGVDPDSTKWKKQNNFTFVKTFTGDSYPDLDDFDTPIGYFEDDFGEVHFEGKSELKTYQEKYNDMHRMLFHPDYEFGSPNFWISRAIDKNIQIPWLKFAEEKGLYKRSSNLTNDVPDKPLRPRTENNYLRLILQLANSNIKNFNPQKPYEAAKLIIENTHLNISEQTIADYITKASTLESKERD